MLATPNSGLSRLTRPRLAALPPPMTALKPHAWPLRPATPRRQAAAVSVAVVLLAGLAALSTSRFGTLRSQSTSLDVPALTSFSPSSHAASLPAPPVGAATRAHVPASQPADDDNDDNDDDGGDGGRDVSCRFPVVYNKPHKTGSSTIRRTMIHWAFNTGRPLLNCRMADAADDARFKRCLPLQPFPCGVLTVHIVLSPQRMAQLRAVLPHFHRLTSTRAPRNRLPSLFLQREGVRLSSAAGFNSSRFVQWLHTINPWELYTYHTGVAVARDTPLDDAMRARMEALAAEYDTVLDVTYMAASNAVLAARGLFQLPQDRRINVRGGALVELDARAAESLAAAAAPEQVLHDALLRRLARDYGAVVGDARCSSAAAPADVVACLRRSLPLSERQLSAA